MARFISQRLLSLVPTMLGLSLIVFLILKLTPGDPAFVLAGANATEEQIRNIRIAYHLDDPLPVQYGQYIVQAIRGGSRPVPAHAPAGNQRASGASAGKPRVGRDGICHFAVGWRQCRSTVG